MPLPTVDGKLSFERAVEAFIEGHVSAKTGRPYSETSKRNIRDNLLGGRLTSWREDQGIRSAADWTAEAAAGYLRWYQLDMGADSDTVKKVRTQLRQFADFATAHLGATGAQGPQLTTLQISSATDRRDAKEAALTQGEATCLLREAPSERDRLIVAMLLYTGMRPSELCALEEGSIHLDRTPPIVQVRGSIHDRDRTKSAAGYRDIPLTIGQNLLPRLLRHHLTDPKRPRTSFHLFYATQLGSRPTGLTQDGVETMLRKLGAVTGIHCNPYRFRHTFCTWCADAGMHMLHLQQLLGHAGSDMVAYYYRGKTSEAVLQAAARIRF